MKKIKNIICNKYFIICLITLFGLFIRLLNIDKPTGLWWDEMSTYIFSSKPLPFGIIKSLWNSDVHMPLFFIYLGTWIKLFGTKDIILRLASVFWSILSIPAFFYLGKTYKSEKLGYLLAIIACLNPIIIYYSQEIRFYSMVIFLGIISLIFFLKTIETPSYKNLIILSFINLVLLYTYSMGIIFVLAELFIIISDFYSHNRTSLKKVLKVKTVLFILLIPYFILLFHYLLRETLFEIPAWGPLFCKYPILVINDWFSPFLASVHGNQKNLYEFYLSSNKGILYLIIQLIPTFCFITGFALNIRETNKKFLYVLTILLAFILAETILWAKGPFVFIVRYTLIVLPIILLLCTNGLMLIKNLKIQYLIFSLIIIIYINNIFHYKTARTFEQNPAGLRPPSERLMKLNPDKDYLMALDGSIIFKKYIKNFNFLNFDINEILYQSDKQKEAYKVFDKNFIETINKKNYLQKFIPFLKNPEPTYELKVFLNSEVNKIPEGKRLIYIEGPFAVEDWPMNSINNFIFALENNLVSKKDYKDFVYYFVRAKISDNVKISLKNNPSLIKINEFKMNSPYTKYLMPVKYTFYVYKKV